MTTKILSSKTSLVFLALTLSVAAGDKSAVSFKNTKPVDYEGGRGLLTLEGPSGMFINPTSGTLPAHAFTAQYCFLLPNNSASPAMAHGAMAAYGITDWLEFGGLFTALAVDSPGRDQFGGGPLVRVRLLKDEGAVPQLSIGGYSRLGDIETYNAFLALYKRLEIDPNGFLRALGFHAGLRETWVGKGRDRTDAPVGYFGMEVQMPYRIYAVGEVSTTDRDKGRATPYSFGLQWRAGGINVSSAFMNDGSFNQPSFFFGIGTALKF